MMHVILLFPSYFFLPSLACLLLSLLRVEFVPLVVSNMEKLGGVNSIYLGRRLIGFSSSFYVCTVGVQKFW
ncbi:hypothetical protein DFP73DRAFT_540252 [Morchella snyderi]|nr:hypothetical protein DFP73DRAFT_540252 [Morchella snyderi]